jgi:hypothetical protein
MRLAIQALVKARRRVQWHISSPWDLFQAHFNGYNGNAEDDPKEWPGPKAWPATLALISFFAVNVFGQVAACILHHSAPLFSASRCQPEHVAGEVCMDSQLQGSSGVNVHARWGKLKVCQRGAITGGLLCAGAVKGVIPHQAAQQISRGVFAK